VTDPLDNPIWHSLVGAHAPLARGAGCARRYPPEVSPFVGLSDAADDRAWRDLADLLVPAESAVVAADPLQVPADWARVMSLDGVQMIAGLGLVGAPDEEAEALGAADVEEMLDLVARTQPGPFGPQTYRMGRYLGIRRGGTLIAMAGERLRPPGWTEISAVCTDPAFRGQGLAARVVNAVCAGIVHRGERPLLHVLASNRSAIALYERLGFIVRRSARFEVVQPPVTR
jgi:ribosomal protein S18 acetylase RimI-like enzyme